MEKILINLNMDNKNDITIENSKTKKKIKIEYTSKILNAQDVYDVFGFEKGNNYDIKNNLDKVNDEKLIEYYTEVINLFNDIKNELNDLTINYENN